MLNPDQLLRINLLARTIASGKRYGLQTDEAERELEQLCTDLHMHAMDGREMDHVCMSAGLIPASWGSPHRGPSEFFHAIVKGLSPLQGFVVNVDPDETGETLEGIATAWTWLHRRLEAYGGRCTIGPSPVSAWRHAGAMGISSNAHPWSSYVVDQLIKEAGEIIGWPSVRSEELETSPFNAAPEKP